MIVKVYRSQAPGFDRTVIDSQDGTFSWEGATPQFAADRLGDRGEASFEATFDEDGGSLILRLGEEVA